MVETTKDCFPNDHIFAIFSNLEAVLPSLGPSSTPVSTNPEVSILSPPNFSKPYPSNPASTDEQESHESTSTIEASANDPTVEIFPTTGVQVLADNIIEDQHEPPPSYSFPTDGSSLLSHPN